MSKSCCKCNFKKSQCEENTEEFEEWRREDVASGDCDINFEGSSPAIESEGASVLWNRSVNRHKMRYKWILSDGNSKTFNTVQHICNDCEVIKLDCVGHVQKRMGKHLMNLKAHTPGGVLTVYMTGSSTELQIAHPKKYMSLKFYTQKNTWHQSFLPTKIQDLNTSILI